MCTVIISNARDICVRVPALEISALGFPAIEISSLGFPALETSALGSFIFTPTHLDCGVYTFELMLSCIPQVPCALPFLGSNSLPTLSPWDLAVLQLTEVLKTLAYDSQTSLSWKIIMLKAVRLFNTQRHMHSHTSAVSWKASNNSENKKVESANENRLDLKRYLRIMQNLFSKEEGIISIELIHIFRRTVNFYNLRIPQPIFSIYDIFI